MRYLFAGIIMVAAFCLILYMAGFKFADSAFASTGEKTYKVIIPDVDKVWITTQVYGKMAPTPAFQPLESAAVAFIDIHTKKEVLTYNCQLILEEQ